MLEKKKLLPEEIDKLNNSRQTEISIIHNIGEVELKLILLNQQKDSLKEEFNNLQKQQQQIAIELQEKYGEGNVNIETGEFTPIQS